MKRIAVLCVLLLSIASLQAQDKIKWMTMNEALAAQEKSPNKMTEQKYPNICPKTYPNKKHKQEKTKQKNVQEQEKRVFEYSEKI